MFNTSSKKPPIEYPEVSGAVCSFNALQALPLKKCLVNITGYQEGTGDPSPSNVRPIHGFSEVNVTRAGKNLFGGEYMADTVVSIVNDERASYKGSDENGKFFTLSAGVIVGSKKFFTKFKPNTQYTFIGKLGAINNPATRAINLRFHYTSGYTDISVPVNFSEQPIQYIAITTVANRTLVDFGGSYRAGVSKIYYEESGIFEGVLTADDLTQYQGNTYTIDLDGTRYGGSLDLVSGVMRVTHEIVDMGDITWTYLDSSSTQFFYGRSRTVKSTSSGNVMPNILADIYKTTTTNTLRNNSDYMVSCGYSGYYGGYLLVKNPDYTDATLFKQAMANHKICYELNTPFEVQLTPAQIETLVNINNLYADTGDTAVEYFKIM